MSWMDNKGNIPKQPIRPYGTEGYNPVDIFYAGDGNAPGGFRVFKYLPVLFDVPVEDTPNVRIPFVLLKGTVVSLLTVYQGSDYGYGTVSGSLTAASGLPVFVDVNGNVISAEDFTFFGYSEHVPGIIVPANGGAAVTYTYTTLDETHGIFKSENSLAAAGDTITLSSNIPVGVLVSNARPDQRGEWLNWDYMGKTYTIYTKCGIKIPYVRQDLLRSAFGLGATAFYNNSSPLSANTVYGKIWKKHVFLWGDNFVAGEYIVPDVTGRYTVQESALNNKLTATPTVQTIGKLLTADPRYPRDLLQYIDQYPGLLNTGIPTGGLPLDLYLFAKDVYVAVKQVKSESVPTGTNLKNAVVALVKEGIIGYATILIDVRI